MGTRSYLIQNTGEHLISQIIRKIDSKGYKGYKELTGKKENIENFELKFLRVQGDPFASPSVVKVSLDFPWRRYGNCRLGVEDYLYRRLSKALGKYSERCGEGHSCFLGVPKPKNIMIRRSGVVAGEKSVEYRFWVGLPARHRRVLGGEAERIIYQKIPSAIQDVMSFSHTSIKEHLISCEIQNSLRNQLDSMGLVSFVPNGALLPRKCGDCEEPLKDAVPFESPPELEVVMKTEHGDIKGMGIKKGITVIAGTAFHGKTTLLNALLDGIYNHVPRDGREGVVTMRDAVNIRAEEGRAVRCVDISSFIYNLPNNKDTFCFNTDNASGATSMAASIQESIEAGSRLIMIDEDTSATNLLFYDDRTSRHFKHKTVSTIVENATSMREKGVSLVMVSSGSAPIIQIADTLIIMEDYMPRVLQINDNVSFGEYKFPAVRKIVGIPRLEKPKIRGSWLTARGLSRPVRLEVNSALREESQMIYIASLLSSSGKFEGLTSEEIAKKIEEQVNNVDALGDNPGFAEIRGLDLVFAINRMPEIKVLH